MAYLPAGQRVTRPGPGGPVTLTARVWSLLDAAYKAAGLAPTDLVVTQGSWHQGTLSGTTHNGGGAFDLRTWNLPADKIEPLVVELRRRGVAAWKRDKDHGGFAPHIHGIVRDEAELSSGARFQVKEYDAGRDGLSSAGPDYHPRPAWAAYRYPPISGTVTIADLRWGRASESSRLMQAMLAAEGFLDPRLVRSTWFVAANYALRKYRTARGMPDNGTAIRYLGRKYDVAVV